MKLMRCISFVTLMIGGGVLSSYPITYRAEAGD